MESPITKIFNSLSDNDVAQAMNEILNLEKTGFISPSACMLPELQRQVKQYTVSDGADLMIVMNSTYRQAAVRWLSERNRKVFSGVFED